jgi:putative IMPACT (imprinted ancient) family translation regulator
VLSSDYGAKVLFTVAVKKAAVDTFERGLVDYMQGRVDILRTGEYYSLFALSGQDLNHFRF